MGCGRHSWPKWMRFFCKKTAAYMAGVRNSFFSHSEISFFGPRRVFFPTFVFFKIYWVFTGKLSKFWRPIAGANSFTPEQVKKGRGFQAFRIYWVTQKILKNTKGPLSRLFIGGKTPPKPPQTNLRLHHIYKRYILQKLGKIGQFCPQQSPKQSTDGYTGLPLPTKWSMQRSQYKGERSSSWMTI